MCCVVLQINAHLYLPSQAAAAATGGGDSATTAAAVDIAADPSDPGCYSLGMLRSYSLLLGGSCVRSEVEEVVMGLTVGAAAQRRYDTPTVLENFKKGFPLLVFIY